MSHQTTKTSLQAKSRPLEDTQSSSGARHRPFVVCRARPGEEAAGQERMKLCKKCESLARGLSNESIHSTLAYSRCRCHRFFKYRAKKLENATSGTVDVVKGTSVTSSNKMAMESDSPWIRRRVDSTNRVTMTRGSNSMKSVQVASASRKRLTASSSILPALPPVSSVTSLSNLLKDESVSTKQGLGSTTTGVALTQCLKPSQVLPTLPPVPSATSLTNLPENESVKCHVSPKKGSSLSLLHTTESPRKVKAKLPPIFSSLANCSISSPKRKPSVSLITELVDIVRIIDSSKRKHLRELFMEIDKNGDGHITCSEFLDSCPVCFHSSTVLLKQFYVALNEATYFGFREFMLCYCIAERLSKSRKLDSFVNVTIEFLETVLCPFIRFLATLANSDGTITQQNIKLSMAHLNQETGKKSFVSTQYLTQIFAEEELSLLDCIAFAPYILK